MTTQEHMSNIEIQGELTKLGLLAQVAVGINTNGLLAAFSYNDTVGVMLDPTGWMAIRDNAAKNERAVRALATFQAELLKVWPELANRE